MQGMRHVSKGLCLSYLWFVMWYEHLLGGFVCDVVCGAVLGSCKGGWAACPGAMLLHFRSASLSLCSCRCTCGVQHGGRVAPPLYVLQSAAP